jgi:hypothetical protein
MHVHDTFMRLLRPFLYLLVSHVMCLDMCACIAGCGMFEEQGYRSESCVPQVTCTDGNGSTR